MLGRFNLHSSFKGYAATCIITCLAFAVVAFASVSAQSSQVENYRRSLYGSWIDADGDCQNTRQEVLIAQSRRPVVLDQKGCRVLKGEWLDPYTNQIFTTPQDLDIDHLVPLKEAHESGGQYWQRAKRGFFANDLTAPYHLVAVYRGANRSKGARDPARWMPSNESFHCTYLERWQAIKLRWQLEMDPTEAQFVESGLQKCRDATDATLTAHHASAQNIRDITP